MAGGSSGDSGKTGEGLGSVVICIMRVELVATKLDLGPNGTNPAGVGVNDTAADSNPGWEAKLTCSLFAESTDQLAGAEVLPVLTFWLVTCGS